MARFEAPSGTIDAVWLAVPPGDQEVLARAALTFGAHVVAEKPWQVSAARSQALAIQAATNNLRLAVHFQYCYLKGLCEMRDAVDGGVGPLRLDGQFTIARENRLELEPYSNLASHILAIQHMHFPDAKLGNLVAAYNTTDHRTVTLSRGKQSATLDFTSTQEPLIQSFVRVFEEDCYLGRRKSSDFVTASNISDQISRLRSLGHWS
jgi:hypothetical protein